MTVTQGKPMGWHKRHAMVMAGQLPENLADAQLVLIALHDLVDNYLSEDDVAEKPRPSNVLAFGGAASTA